MRTSFNGSASIYEQIDQFYLNTNVTTSKCLYRPTTTVVNWSQPVVKEILQSIRNLYL